MQDRQEGSAAEQEGEWQNQGMQPGARHVAEEEVARRGQVDLTNL